MGRISRGTSLVSCTLFATCWDVAVLVLRAEARLATPPKVDAPVFSASFSLGSTIALSQYCAWISATGRRRPTAFQPARNQLLSRLKSAFFFRVQRVKSSRQVELWLRHSNFDNPC